MNITKISLLVAALLVCAGSLVAGGDEQAIVAGTKKYLASESYTAPMKIEVEKVEGDYARVMVEPKDKQTDGAIEEAVQYLHEQGVTVDDKTMKQSEGKINGMDGVDVTWKGKDKEGDAIISLTILAAKKDKVLLITYWASPEGTKKYAKELGTILNSIKSIM